MLYITSYSIEYILKYIHEYEIQKCNNKTESFVKSIYLRTYKEDICFDHLLF